MAALSLMIFPQQSGADQGPGWRLPAGRALSFAVDRRGCWLAVREGRVWLTVGPARRGEGASDRWIVAGGSAWLAPRSRAVVEGWPSAVFELLRPPPPVARRPGRWLSAAAPAPRLR